ncbi:MAG: hypothetical protein JNM69_38205 [Archangium sp.]|nr:hypothetical protein [Archangium sp.]
MAERRFSQGGVEVVLFDDGRLELQRPGVPPTQTTAALVLGWPEAVVGQPLGAVLRSALLARLGTVERCAACGGPVVRREVVRSVHPASGDGYGVVQTRCLGCSAVDEWPFSDN